MTEPKPYTPELGQAFFGVPWGEFEAPEFVVAGLKHLGDEISRVEWNLRQEQFDPPTANSGNSFSTDVFVMRAYYWGDCECKNEHASDCPVAAPNFKCGNFEVRWYKHVQRGTSMNRAIEANEFAIILDKCMESVRKKDKVL